MNPTDMKESFNVEQKNFWDSLQSEILHLNQKLSPKEVLSLVERDFMFSMFFRGCSPLEINYFQSILDIKDNGYIILAQLLQQDKSNIADIEIDELSLHLYLKEILAHKSIALGPLIANRICILITADDYTTKYSAKEESIETGQAIINALHKKFKISVSLGIGTVQNITSIYASFIDAMSCLHYAKHNQLIHIQDIKKPNLDQTFDFVEAEKYMLEAIRLHKVEAYDYFSLMMDWIRPMNDQTKRDKILEILVLASHAMRIDNPSEVSFNYTSHVNELMGYNGDQLMEWAFQSFIVITGYVKPINSIDYSNKIVQATKEYLETHYADEISLENVAEQVNISPQYFSKLIKKTTGFNFIDWLSMLRVKKAKELLSNSNFTVKEVCFMVGYKDPNYFSRIFKKRIGITPSEYIKSNPFNNMN
jgi:two-component system response regulator YesN